MNKEYLSFIINNHHCTLHPKPCALRPLPYALRSKHPANSKSRRFQKNPSGHSAFFSDPTKIDIQ